jgi:iron transport multicopper oxidase
MSLRRLRVIMTMSLAATAAACDGAPAGGPVEVVHAAATVQDVDSTMAADPERTGFYPNQPALDPVTVGSPFFGQIFDASVDGSIYAQPLVAAGVLFIATETNHLYALDPGTGAVIWTRDLGTPFQASDLNCGDLQPSIGVTGTPAIDAATGTAYLLSKSYANGVSGTAIWTAHAVDLATGAERDGFPVTIAGAASNAPTQVFDPTHQHQRPGLLLMNGVVYAAFGAHCDERPYQGWIVGVSTRGFVQTMWTSEADAGNPSGGGIWMSGGGLVSDDDGQILFATGNDWTNYADPIPGRRPPANLGESIVRLTVQADGSLAATDFFSPGNRTACNVADADVGSGAPIALPAVFGTPSHPDVLAQAGKPGWLYLLDRDDLGGYQMGPGGADKLLASIGGYAGAGVWSKPSVWPGDGGYLYLPVANGCTSSVDPAGCLRAYHAGATADGTPSLALAGTTSSSFAYGSSAVVVTADGTRSGSALLWTIWSSGWTGAGSELRAYDAVPVDGTLPLRYLAGIGTSAKFTTPAVGDGRIYVGTRDGHVLGFGITGTPALRASGAAFPPTLVGDDAFASVAVTASGAVTVLGLATTGDFVLTAASPVPPFPVAAGATVQIPIDFRPSTEGPLAGTLSVTTVDGTFAIPLTGVGQSKAPKLATSPAVVMFSPVVVGSVSTATVTITNVSDADVTLTGIAPPAPPFAVSGLPDPGAVLEPGASFIATLTYAPATAGTSAGYLGIEGDTTMAAIPVEGAALMGGKLRIAPDTINAETMTVGDVSTASFMLANDGDLPIIIEKSKPPTSPAFQAQSPLDEGTAIAQGATLEVLVRVSPTAVGANTDVWQINASDGQGLRLVTMTVTGAARPTPAPTPTPAPAPAASSPDGGAPSAAPLAAASAEDPPAYRAVSGGGCSVGGAAPSGLPALGLALLALGARRRRRAP